jgi:hypothetical protein
MVDRAACDVPRARAHRARRRGGARGTSDARIKRMKIVLLLVFLGLGPALAEQTSTPPGYPALDPAVAPAARAGLMRPTDRVSRAALTDDEIARYCGRRS